MSKQWAEIEAGVVIAEWRCSGPVNPRGSEDDSLIDVTTRTDGPFIGKVYDQATDTFSDPPG